MEQIAASNLAKFLPFELKRSNTRPYSYALILKPIIILDKFILARVYVCGVEVDPRPININPEMATRKE